jgi:hypothetical protein
MQLALGALGAAAGNFLIPGGFLGMSGASIGWAVGSAVGGMFAEGPVVEGPRLTDKSVSSSTYGNLRPIVYGSYRVGGEIIWSTNLKEHKHEEEQGKGGGGGATYVTYTYTVSFAAALCEGQINGVRKIWLDSKLVYSAADDASVGELYKSSKLAKSMRVYPGSTTQTADPTMESYLGAGNVPGYRGTAYIVFEDLDVTNYGNRIPQITVEVSTGVVSIASSAINTTYTGNRTNLQFRNGVVKFISGGTGADSSNFRINTMDTAGNIIKSQKKTIQKSDGRVIANAYPALGGQVPYYWGTYSISASGKFLLVDVGRSSGTSRHVGVMHASGNGYDWVGMCLTDNDLLDDTDFTDRSMSAIAVENDDVMNPLSVYVYHFPDGKLYRFDVTINFLGQLFMLEWPTWEANVDLSWYDTDSSSAFWPGFCVDEDTGDIFCLLKNKDTDVTSVKRFTNDGDFVEEKLVGVAPEEGIHAANIAFSDGKLWAITGGTTTNLEVYDWDSEELLYQTPMSGLISGSAQGVHAVAAGNIMMMDSGGIISLFKIAMTRGSIGLDDVVTSICQKSGLELSEIDATDLASDTVRGMVIGRQMSGRGAIQHLGGPYFFDGVESDGILKFVKRGGSSIATLEDDDMGCYEGEVVELWKATRTQEEELPKQLTFMYSRYNADYQQGAQHALRESVLSGNNLGVEFSIAFTDDEAKAICDTLMFTAWHNRHGFVIPTWQKFSKVEPSDIITAGGETIRITKRNEGVNGLIELEGVRELPAIYTGQVGTGASGSVGGQTVRVGGPTDFELLDIQNLRDRDYNTYGIYVAAAGYLDDWDGCAVLKSPDNGDNFTLLETMNAACVFGQATTALGNFYGGNIFDDLNTVRVSVNGTLSSSTWDGVLNGANAMLLGDEIIQFRTATLVSTGIYDLTGLLRGRRGTEWAMSTHAVNERAVLLNDSLHFIALDSTDFNTQRLLGVVSSGDTIADIETDTITYSGENLKPFPPVHLAATLASDSSINLSWDQRTRYNGLWLSGRAPSEDEPTTEFEVVIYSDSNFTTALRTTTGITSSPWNYTVAMQTADYGKPVKTVHYKVRQVGSARSSEWASFTGTVTNVGSMILMHFDGAQDAIAFTDVYGHAFTRGGLTRLRTEGAKFGSASLYCPGTGDYIRTPYAIELDPEYFDFTYECWLNLSGYRAGTNHIAGTFRMDGSGNGYGWQFALDSTGHPLFRYGMGGSPITVATSASAVATGSHKHVAVTRLGNTLTLWLEGSSVATGTLVGDIRYTASYFQIGCSDDTTSGGYVQANSLFGYKDEARFSKGIARYTAGFTPPSSAFTS